MDQYLIRDYGLALRDPSLSQVVDLSKKVDINFNFQIHKINDLVKEFNGNMPPNKFPQHVLAIIGKGEGQKQIGSIKFDIGENVAFYIGKNSVHSSSGWALGTEGYMLTFSDNFFNESSIKVPMEKINLLSKKSVVPYRPLTNEYAENILTIFKEIEFEKNNNKVLYNSELLAVKVTELLYKYLRVFELTTETKNNYLFDKFLGILEKDFTREKFVKYYSDRLNVHPNYLNKIVKDNIGESAKNIIRNRVIIESKYLLCNTNLSIKEISIKLGFNDQNSFSRYFKQSEGIPLTNYRKKSL